MRKYNEEQHLFELCDETSSQIEQNIAKLDKLGELDTLEKLNEVKKDNIKARNFLVNLFQFLKYDDNE